jgi:energy-coupling factor transporter ATP-binding protein EcfA2
MEKSELEKLITYLEENTRADKVSGIDFIDPRNFKTKVRGKQNYVVFGRRGAGKSTLLKTLNKYAEAQTIYVNLEDYKDITFPNIIIKVLCAFYCEIVKDLNYKKSLFKKKNFFATRKIVKEINSVIEELNKKLIEPDNYSERKKQSNKSSSTDEVSGKSNQFSAKTSVTSGSELEVEHSWEIDKLNELKTSIDVNKSLISKVIEFNKSQLILILDDFYFIPKDIQPFLLDYFHRLSKSNDFYLKIGTIKHRSHLYFQSSKTYIGMELNADIYDIDLDYTLDKWNELKQFKRELLKKAIQASGAKFDIDSVFNEQSFSQLCIASGGVPRDFLVLFIKSCQLITDKKARITVPDVREIAIQNFVNKKNALEKDSAEDSNALELYINYLRDYIFNQKRTNVFLIENDSLNKNEKIKQVIRELVDLRFLHVIDNNTSAAPSDGKRYSAYLLDVSLYDNGRPRNFKEVEPDIQTNRQAVRGAPRITTLKLAELHDNNK